MVYLSHMFSVYVYINFLVDVECPLQNPHSHIQDLGILGISGELSAEFVFAEITRNAGCRRLLNMLGLHNFGTFDSLPELPKCLPELPEIPRSWMIISLYCVHTAAIVHFGLGTALQTCNMSLETLVHDTFIF